jgi:hypothetical protein
MARVCEYVGGVAIGMFQVYKHILFKTTMQLMRRIKHLLPTNFEKLAQRFGEWDNLTPNTINFQSLN